MNKEEKNVRGRLIGYLVSMALLAGTDLFAIPCPEGHCTAVAPKVARACAKNGNKGEAYFEVPGQDEMCSCPCSCFDQTGTLMTLAHEMRMDELKVGDEVVTPAGKSKIREVKHSDVVKHPVIKITMDDTSSFTVSTNHPFLREGSLVTEAQRLKVGDKLQGSEGRVRTVKAIDNRTYTGPLYNVVLDSEDEDGSGKVYYSRGVASGDYTVQSYRDFLRAEVNLREIMKAKSADRE